jgi:hypothetical protein
VPGSSEQDNEFQGSINDGNLLTCSVTVNFLGRIPLYEVTCCVPVGLSVLLKSESQ